jgi:hypothetical protein
LSFSFGYCGVYLSHLTIVVLDTTKDKRERQTPQESKERQTPQESKERQTPQ